MLDWLYWFSKSELASERRSDQVGHSLHQQEETIGVREPVESDQFHQDDTR